MMARRVRKPRNPLLTEREAKIETRAIWAFIIVVTILIVLALYGYFTGAWEPPPADVT